MLNTKKEKRNAWHREYRKNPIVKEKENRIHIEYLKKPKNRERVRFLQRERYKRPEVQNKIRDWDLKKAFGITLGEYNVLLDSQNGKCVICGKEEIRQRNGKIKHLAVDHNHKTGKVRGLVCHDCNVALGYLKEDINTMKKMIEYIEKFNS
jgi:hypothetical protein